MKKILILIPILFIISNCNLKKNVEHHGVNLLEKKNTKLIINETNKNDILKVLGPPSVQSTFDNDLMFYIERKIIVEGIYKLGKRKTIKNNVLIVELNDRGVLVKKEFIDLNQMNDVDIAQRITEIDYQKTSFIYDFLSSMRQKVNDPLGKKRKKFEQ